MGGKRACVRASGSRQKSSPVADAAHVVARQHQRQLPRAAGPTKHVCPDLGCGGDRRSRRGGGRRAPPQTRDCRGPYPHPHKLERIHPSWGGLRERAGCNGATARAPALALPALLTWHRHLWSGPPPVVGYSSAGVSPPNGGAPHHHRRGWFKLGNTARSGQQDGATVGCWVRWLQGERAGRPCSARGQACWRQRAAVHEREDRWVQATSLGSFPSPPAWQ